MPLFGKNKDGSKKRLKDTELGAFLKEKAPALFHKVADFLPDKGVLGIIKHVIDHDPAVNAEWANMSAADKIQFEKLQKDYELEVLKAEMADRQNARSREVEYIKATGHVDWMMYTAGIIALGAFVFIVVTAVYKPDVFKDNPILHQIIGMVEGVALSVFGYYFSSSRGSKQKTDMMERMINAKGKEE